MKKYLILLFTFFFITNVTALETICSPTDCYTVVEELGEGAFGKVYSVVNSQGEPFAIKSYKPMNDTSDMGWKLLGDVEREFQLGQLFDHPHIIHSLELFQGSNGETFYILMELVEGKTISRTQKKSLSEQQSLTVAFQLIDALRYAHSMGYLYLDLHQGNIMLTDTQEIKVVDLASFFSWDELLSFNNKKAKGMNMGAARAKKLEQFIGSNPRLIKKGLTPVKAYWNTTYFDRVTDLCIEIIRKSDLSIEDKIEKRTQIKVLAWEYQENAEDGTNERSLDDYFDELVSIITP